MKEKIQKMRMLLLVFCSMPLTAALAQVYTDPAVAAATRLHAGVMNSQLNEVNSNLTLIQRGQLAVTGQLAVANELQNNIYKGLSEISGAVRSLLAVRDIAGISLDIVSHVEKAMAMAGRDPVLLLFAQEGAREFKVRSAQLAAEVSAFVLKGGADNLMDAGERAKLLNGIRTELSILRGIAFGMHRSMFWAKHRGLQNVLNPYSTFVNIDKQIAEDIIRNSKLVRR